MCEMIALNIEQGGKSNWETRDRALYVDAMSAGQESRDEQWLANKSRLLCLCCSQSRPLFKKVLQNTG